MVCPEYYTLQEPRVETIAKFVRNQIQMTYDNTETQDNKFFRNRANSVPNAMKQLRDQSSCCWIRLKSRLHGTNDLHVISEN